jgi:hypothetical protein
MDDAIAVLQEGRRLVDERRLRGSWCSDVHNGEAEVLVVQVERSEERQRAQGLALLRRVCQAAEQRARAYRLNLPQALRLRGTYEWLQKRREPAMAWWGRSLAAAEQIGIPYERAQAHLEIGRRTKDEEHLAHGRAILQALCAAESRQVTPIRMW